MSDHSQPPGERAPHAECLAALSRHQSHTARDGAGRFLAACPLGGLVTVIRDCTETLYAGRDCIAAARVFAEALDATDATR